SLASDIAFAHALRLALATGAELAILHADQNGTRTPWLGLPGVHHAAVRWGLLPAGSSRDDLARLGLSVCKTEVQGVPPLEAILGELARHPADLLVLASHRLHGLERLRHRPVAAPAARRARTLTLFVPEHASA